MAQLPGSYNTYRIPLLGWKIKRYVDPEDVDIQARFIEIIDNYMAEKSMYDVNSKGSAQAGMSISKIYTKLKNSVLQALGLDSRGGFTPPEWDFEDVSNVAQSESQAKRAIEKYVEQIWKQGWEFKGKNPKTVKYIRKRFKQIALVTSKPTLVLFTEIASALVTFGNSIIIKKRKESASSGRVRKTFTGKTLKPIAGLYTADPSSMWPKRDEYGNVKKWKQMPFDRWTWEFRSRKNEWSPDDVIHIADRSATPTKFFFAIPMLLPVIPDIRALREMEELSMIQAIKFATPRYHARVGEKDRPGTDKEIMQLAKDLDALPDDAALVTSSRAVIDNVSNGDQVLQLDPYLNYWTARIRAGLGMSGVAMGEGNTANRNTAQTMVAEMQNTTIKFQQLLKTYIEEIIKELLYEAGYSEHTLSDDDMVYLHVPEIDLQNKIAKDNHALNQFQSDLLTHDEARLELGRDPLPESERKNLYSNIKAEIDAKAQAQANKIANINQPANQHGKQAAKPKQAKDELEDDSE
jgi:hypothetical protein